MAPRVRRVLGYYIYNETHPPRPPAPLDLRSAASPQLQLDRSPPRRQADEASPPFSPHARLSLPPSFPLDAGPMTGDLLSVPSDFLMHRICQIFRGPRSISSTLLAAIFLLAVFDLVSPWLGQPLLLLFFGVSKGNKLESLMRLQPWCIQRCTLPTEISE